MLLKCFFLLTCFSFMTCSPLVPAGTKNLQFNLACKLGSKPQYQDPIRDITMAEPEDDFQEFLRLDQHIQKFLPLGETDLTSPTCARIRALWTKCKIFYSATPIPPAQPFPPTPPSTEPSSQITATSDWHETLPPKLSIEDLLENEGSIRQKLPR